jgi:predicted O-methyltransferase YrrM
MGCEITAIEDDALWLNAVQTELRNAEVTDRVHLLHIPCNFDDPAAFSRSDYCLALNSREWDVVIIDGQDKTFKERVTCFRQAELLMKPGSIILVDDFWRYEELLDRHRAHSVRIHESVGPCRIGVTSTAMFFY